MPEAYVHRFASAAGKLKAILLKRRGFEVSDDGHIPLLAPILCLALTTLETVIVGRIRALAVACIATAHDRIRNPLEESDYALPGFRHEGTAIAGQDPSKYAGDVITGPGRPLWGIVQQ